MICVLDFVVNLSRTLSPTFPVHCNGLNSIRATQTGLSRTCHGLCHKHLDMSRWFVSATFVIYVHDFPCGEVSVKVVSVMEFGLNRTGFELPSTATTLDATHEELWLSERKTRTTKARSQTFPKESSTLPRLFINQAINALENAACFPVKTFQSHRRKMHLNYVL